MRQSQKCGSGTESSWFDQTHLIPSSREFTALVALNDDSSTGLDANHSCTNPAESG